MGDTSSEHGHLLCHIYEKPWTDGQPLTFLYIGFYEPSESGRGPSSRLLKWQRSWPWKAKHWTLHLPATVSHYIGQPSFTGSRSRTQNTCGLINTITEITFKRTGGFCDGAVRDKPLLKIVCTAEIPDWIGHILTTQTHFDITWHPSLLGMFTHSSQSVDAQEEDRTGSSWNNLLH